MLIVSVCAPCEIFAQGDEPLTMSISMDGALSASMLGWHPTGRLGLISGVERSFGLKELDAPWVSFGLRQSRFSFEIGAYTLGWSQMRQWTSLVSSKYDLEGISIAVGVEHRLLQLKHPYSNDAAIIINTGLIKSVGNDVWLSANAQNLLGSTWLRGGDPVERRLLARLLFSPQSRLHIAAGIEVSDHFPIDYNGFVAWRPHEVVTVKLGAGTEPSRMEVGLVIDKQGWLSGIGMSKITNSSIGWRQNYWIGRVTA